MAQQIPLPETAEVKSYLSWLVEQSGCDKETATILQHTDFRWTIEDDKNRAEAGLKLRERYADSVGSELSDVQRDRIRKSIHGKTSCMEVILNLAEEIDAMVNEDEEPKVKDFFGLLLKNLGIDGDDNTNIAPILTRWLDRDYEEDEKYCLFPVTEIFRCDKKVSQTMSLWMQMNRWVEANSDENGCFVTEKRHSVTVSK